MKHVAIRGKKIERKEVHLVEEIFAVILMGDGNELFKVASSNTFDQSILGFCHSVPNFMSRYECLGCNLTVQSCCSIRYIG